MPSPPLSFIAQHLKAPQFGYMTKRAILALASLLTKPCPFFGRQVVAVLWTHPPKRTVRRFSFFSSVRSCWRVAAAAVQPTLAIREFSIPAVIGASGIVTGPDGNLWFTESSANKIGQITPAGVYTGFPVPVLGFQGSHPQGITVGPDHALWFTDTFSNQIGRITLSGSVTTFALPSPQNAGPPQNFPTGITAGPDGNLWFTEETVGQIGRITPAGIITEYPIPTPNSAPEVITKGPGGTVWFVEGGPGNVAVFSPPMGQ